MTEIDNGYKHSEQLSDNYYEVERGDNLDIIANKFNTTVSAVANLNELQTTNSIQIGQRLMLPLEEPTNLNISTEGIASIAIISPRVLSSDTPAPNPARLPSNRSSKKTSSDDVVSSSVIVNQVIASNEPTLPETNPIENLFTNLDPTSENPPISSTSDQPLPVREQPVSRSPLNSTPVSLGIEVTAASSNIETEGILDTDPANYYVDIEGNIEAQASETIARLANWLDIRAWDIRRLNNMNYRDQIFIGKKVLLDFNKISITDFEISRRDYHANLQRDFFDTHQIKGSEKYEIKLNDNIDRLAKNTYSAPLWLVRQYNPDLDFSRIKVGQKVSFPLLEITEE